MTDLRYSSSLQVPLYIFILQVFFFLFLPGADVATMGRGKMRRRHLHRVPEEGPLPPPLQEHHTGKARHMGQGGMTASHPLQRKTSDSSGQQER